MNNKSSSSSSCSHDQVLLLLPSTSSHDLINIDSSNQTLEEDQHHEELISSSAAAKHGSCPSCGHKLQPKTAADWVGLPAGVKFDPTDQELIEHLEAKVGPAGSGKELLTFIKSSHPLIDEFIPTIQGEDGICYTHPEKLPGVTRDGLSRHFFHRPSKAYTTGTRKRRKIQLTECDGHLQAAAGGETRWHKTGKTRPVMANGKQKGCKKILVLYTNFGKNRKPEKTNWVMHQYHLGQHEEEREGELVVSKIFYQTQPRQCNWAERSSISNSTSGLQGGNRTSDHLNNTSSKEVIITSTQRDEFSGRPSISSYAALEIQQLNKADHFGYLPFRKSFDHEAGNTGEASMAREGEMAASGSGTCDMSQHHVTVEPTQHRQQQIASTAYHVITRPSHSISAIISPPSSLHHTSIILDQDHSFNNAPTNMLPTDHFQQQQHQEQDQEQHHKIGGRSAASGLEELIMGCTGTSSSTDMIKQESPITNQQEADWLKYSTFWPDPDHHG
ncbi:hypothetical protein ACJIZ3_018748 [Penstemon smallii]|uniref:NAC domain-containing protein n=1 Tax=Penstemon smallii TaxID=265156 RepID=A0ABD3T033_9LAMI